MVYLIIQYLAIVSGLSAQRLWGAACAKPSARLQRMAVLGCVIFGQLLTPAWAATLANGQALAPAQAQPAPTALSDQIYPLNQLIASMEYAQTATDLIVSTVNRNAQSSTTVVGNSVSANNIFIQADQDVILQATRLKATSKASESDPASPSGTPTAPTGGLIQITAGGNLAILDAQNTTSSADERYSASRRLINQKSSTDSVQTTTSTSVGSSIDGKLVMTTSGGNTLIQGSQIKGTDGVGVFAGGNLTVVEGRNTSTREELHESKKTGLNATASIVPMISGSTGQQTVRSQSSSTVVDSAISSANGNVVLKSGGDLFLSGAQVTAAPDKAITLDGRSVTTIGSVNYESDTSVTKSKGPKANLLGTVKLGEGINAKNTTTNASAATSINRTSLTAGNVNVIAHLDEPLSEAAKADKAQALAALSPAERAAYNDYQAKRAKAGSITLAGTTFNTTPAGTYGSGPGNTATGIVSLDAPGGLNFNLQQTTREASTSSAGKDLVFQKNKNQGQADTTSEYVKINGSVALSTQTTVVNVQLAAPTQQTQTKAPKKDEAPSAATRTDNLTLDQRATEVAKQPGMAWLGQLQSDPTIKAQIGSVKYKEIEEAHKTWNYKQQGLTPEGAAIVAVVVTYFTAGAASGAATSLGMTTVNAAGATVLSVGGTAIAAGLTTLSVQAATAILNNNGDISAALKELGSKENVKGLLTAMVTAGALNGLNASLGWTEVTAKSPFTQQLGKNLVNGITSSLIGSAINGTPPEQALKNAIKGAFIDTLAANVANAIGDARLDQFTSKLAHAMLGCATGAAIGDNKGSCAAGAIGAVVAELTAEWYNSGNTTGQPKPDTLALSNLVAQVAVAVAGGNASQIGIGGRTGSNAVANNYLNHLRPDQMRLSERERLLAARAECQSNPSSGACGEMNRLNALSQQRDTVLRNACLTPTAPECRAEIKRATDAGNILDLRTGIPYSPADGPPATIGPVRSPALDSYGYQQGGNLSEALIQESFGQVGVAALRGVLALGQVVVTGMRVTTNGAVEFVNGTGQVTARVVNGEVLDSAGVVIARQNPINPTQYTPVAGQPLLTPSGSFATAPNSAYFWSGLGRNGDTIAANIAGQNGGITLETLMLQRGISLPSWDATNPLVVQAWRNASGTYASAASGDVRVVLGPQVRSDSVWNTIEYDALRNNPNVTRIIQVDPVTGRQTILYRR